MTGPGGSRLGNLLRYENLLCRDREGAVTLRIMRKW